MRPTSLALTVGQLAAAAFLVCLLLVVLGGVTATADSHKPTFVVNPVGPPVATEGLRVQWWYEDSTPTVQWFEIVREAPPKVWRSEQFNGYVDDTEVQRGQVYRYRVCAVYLNTNSCYSGGEGWVSAQLPAATVATTPTDGLLRDQYVRFESLNYRNHFIRHRLYLGELTPTPNRQDVLDSDWRVHPALSGTPGAVSVESCNYPGHFLRHEKYRLRLSPRGDTPLFRQDASFYARPALDGTQYGVSFESVNFPRHYIRHQNLELWLARSDMGNTSLFPSDTSFLPRPTAGCQVQPQPKGK